MRRVTPIVFAAALPLLTVTPAQALLALRVASAVAAPGGTVDIDVTLETDRDDVAGLDNRLTWASPLLLRDCIADPGVQRLTSFDFRPQDCETSQCTSMRAIVLAFGSMLADGAVLYRCKVDIAAGAQGGEYSVACAEAVGATASAEELPADCLSGVIEVVAPTPTPTSTPTATPTPSPSASATASTPAATTTAVATATPTDVPLCAGDCDGDGRVGIDEIVTAVRIALGLASPDRCVAVDGNGDATVVVAELIRSIGNALDGC